MVYYGSWTKQQYKTDRQSSRTGRYQDTAQHRQHHYHHHRHRHQQQQQQQQQQREQQQLHMHPQQQRKQQQQHQKACWHPPPVAGVENRGSPMSMVRRSPSMPPVFDCQGSQVMVRPLGSPVTSPRAVVRTSSRRGGRLGAPMPSPGTRNGRSVSPMPVQPTVGAVLGPPRSMSPARALPRSPSPHIARTMVASPQPVRQFSVDNAPPRSPPLPAARIVTASPQPRQKICADEARGFFVNDCNLRMGVANVSKGPVAGGSVSSNANGSFGGSCGSGFRVARTDSSLIQALSQLQPAGGQRNHASGLRGAGGASSDPGCGSEVRSRLLELNIGLAGARGGSVVDGCNGGRGLHQTPFQFDTDREQAMRRVPGSPPAGWGAPPPSVSPFFVVDGRDNALLGEVGGSGHGSRACSAESGKASSGFVERFSSGSFTSDWKTTRHEKAASSFATSHATSTTPSSTPYGERGDVGMAGFDGLGRDATCGRLPKPPKASDYAGVSEAELKLELKRRGYDSLFCFTREDLVDRLLDTDRQNSANVQTTFGRDSI
eukprot:TRINITY_DN16617_c0_g1_i2.p1 TRINITY_DN16617_c0_g1~~TRINITY_DN16617_c0_g1_i2.p1  ORF type:complete len:583 (-),score=97.06 TRINITY_DN16617_c0_g1_i2:118-1755(-)